ncbi:MAG: rRNA adenine N(6)-methyltransferase family protein [Oscillospiraceae bacterium]|nr:rRNA adenine N(6)-methyltransferase family protein [Oscillospiraceae bacterium]
MSKSNTNSSARAGNALAAAQNFLTSAALIRRLVALANLRREDHIVEIGPGKGHITRVLLTRCDQVTAVELDPALCARLRDRFGGTPGLQLVAGDFLAWPLPRTPYKVFSNLPFNQTSAILRKLTQGLHPPEEAWLVVEKGAAKRFLGSPRENLASLSLKPWFDAKLCWYFRREDFHPMPGVDAVLLHLKRKPAPDLPPPPSVRLTPALWRPACRGQKTPCTCSGSACSDAGGAAAAAESGRRIREKECLNSVFTNEKKHDIM